MIGKKIAVKSRWVNKQFVIKIFRSRKNIQITPGFRTLIIFFRQKAASVRFCVIKFRCLHLHKSKT